MKRFVLIMCATLLCVGCAEKQEIQQEITREEKPVLQQEITLDEKHPEYSKGLHSYQITYPDGSIDFLYQDDNNFVTGCVTSSGEVWNVFVWDRDYPQSIYRYWIEESPELAISYRDNYNSMIDCFDTNADQCEIYVAQ